MLSIKGERLSLSDIESVALHGATVELDSAAIERVRASRRVVDSIVRQDAVVYGVSTGFGKLADVQIPHEQLEELQLNLVRSHCCGLGDPLPEPEVRAMMLLRANVLAIGFSGIRVEVVETLLAMLNAGVHPVIPSQGSVGASGDLAPLAHLALAVIGEGEAIFGGKRLLAQDGLQRAGIQPVKLQAKEGLALLNGTQAMGAVGGLALARALHLIEIANVAGAMTLEALLGTPTAFDEQIQRARPHPGQVECAAMLRHLLRESEIRDSHLENDPRVQDAYSLRCMPQVHGAALGALRHVQEVLEMESASATDNPLIFPETGDVLSGGNFHGAPLALALDYAAVAVTDLCSMCERRIDRLVNPDVSEHLPAFLAKNPGCESGLMIAHVAAAALLNECKVLSHPSSIDNVPTSAGKEDHVSMGMTGALKLRRIVDNAEKIFAIELMAAAEGLEYRKPLKPGVGVNHAYNSVRSFCPAVEGDRVFSYDIERLATAIRDRQINWEPT
jgi:histidine ammonia-lyase